MWLWLGFHFSFLPYWFFLFLFFFLIRAFDSLAADWAVWLELVTATWQQSQSGWDKGGVGGGVLSLNKRCKKEKNESNMSTGASWRTIPACLAASYSFGTVFWMNVNLLKKTKRTSSSKKKKTMDFLFLFLTRLWCCVFNVWFKLCDWKSTSVVNVDYHV